MYEADLEIPIKVLIVGNGAVGKSSMIQRYCKGIYTNDYKKTIGVDFLEKKIRHGCGAAPCMPSLTHLSLALARARAAWRARICA